MKRMRNQTLGLSFWNRPALFGPVGKMVGGAVRNNGPPPVNPEIGVRPFPFDRICSGPMKSATVPFEPFAGQPATLDSCSKWTGCFCWLTKTQWKDQKEQVLLNMELQSPNSGGHMPQRNTSRKPAARNLNHPNRSGPFEIDLAAHILVNGSTFQPLVW